MAVDADAADRKLTTDAADSEPVAAAGVTDDGQDTEAPEGKSAATGGGWWSDVRFALVTGVAVVLALAGLAGWLGFRIHQGHQTQAQRDLFLEAGRQGAVNLTTISYSSAEADIQRLLDSSTGALHDEFQERSQSYIDVVEKVQSATEGTVTEAGLETYEGDHAHVLVSLAVKTTKADQPEQAQRLWRMRLDVQKVDDGAKLAGVEFVS